MTVNLKIEIIKIFSLELNFSSDKQPMLKKEKQDEKAANTQHATGKSTSAG